MSDLQERAEALLAVVEEMTPGKHHIALVALLTDAPGIIRALLAEVDEAWRQHNEMDAMRALVAIEMERLRTENAALNARSPSCEGPHERVAHVRLRTSQSGCVAALSGVPRRGPARRADAGRNCRDVCGVPLAVDGQGTAKAVRRPGRGERGPPAGDSRRRGRTRRQSVQGNDLSTEARK